MAGRKRSGNVDGLVRDALGSSPDGAHVLDGVLESALDRPSSLDVDLWEDLDVLTEPAEFRPKLAEDLEIKIFRLRWGNDYAMVGNPRDLKHLQLEVWEAELLELFDGEHTLGDIVVERLEGAGDFDPEGVVDLVGFMRRHGFLDPQPADVDEAMERALESQSLWARISRFMKTLKIDWYGAERLVQWFYRNGLRLVFTRIGASLAIAIAVLGFVAFLDVEASGRFSLAGESPATDTLIILGLGFVLTFAHELSHALVLVHYGRHLKSAGFLIYFGDPAFFVDSSDGLMMDRGKRMLQALGGPLGEAVLAGVAALFLWGFPSSGIANVLYRFSVLNYLVIFLNLIPLLELDGYLLLCDLIQVPDLRPRSLTFIQHDLFHKLRARERFTRQEIGLGLYGLIGIVFTIISVWTAIFWWREIFGGLVSSLWNGGIGGRLLLLALAVVLGGPAIRGLIQLVRALGRRISKALASLRFRAEREWRIEAAKLIDQIPAFDDLPVELLNDLSGRIHLRSLSVGQPVFRQGDRADAFYVVRSGTLHVEDEDPETGDTRMLSALGPGASFGELGLLRGAGPPARVRAETDAEVFRVDKGTFDHLLSDRMTPPDFAPTLQAMAELRDLPAFSHASSKELGLVLEHGEWRQIPPGEEILVQGEPSDAFYVIGSGRARVVKDDRPVAELGPGSHFGEIGLLRDVPRTATVEALAPMRVFRLDREGFNAVVAGAFNRGALRAATDRTWKH
jgi:CRP-like cAMP-binding protein/Zn-dependent protease